MVSNYYIQHQFQRTKYNSEISDKKMDEWCTDEKEVMKILVEVATSKREAEIVSRVGFT
jgi:hypothetical protein